MDSIDIVILMIAGFILGTLAWLSGIWLAGGVIHL
jgi:hypothetical protein